MNRLWVRLSLAFVAITLLSVFSVAVLVDVIASQSFSQYVTRQDLVVQNGLLDDLAVYYQHHGNWNGVESILSSPSGGGAGRGGRGRPVLLLADSRGQIVYDEHATRIGEMLTTDEREHRRGPASGGANLFEPAAQHPTHCGTGDRGSRRPAWPPH